MSLIVLGSVAFDAIETPFGKTDKIVGGAAPYASLSASYIYPHVKIVGVVGNDFGEDNLKILSDHSIDIEGIQVKKDEKTFFWSGKYHNDMNSRDSLITDLNVLADFDPIIPSSYQDCEYILLGNLAPQVQLTALQRLEKRPKLIAMDTMNFWIESAMDDLKETLQHIDVLIINDEEARQLSGEYALVTAAETIMAMGPRYLIIKKGEHGALLFGDKQVFSAPALPLATVFDPTGAGDTFAGGFVGYLAQYGQVNFQTMKTAVIYGSAMASFCVEQFGTERLQGLTKKEIGDRLRQFSQLSSFVL
ncbi:PfkB family carbohydrate kinase [Olivibacter sitiensis]|uniref:PfkB family carbohydrate kinase n=1 Tax=Olivibacter sitiensis TaxID=376470 RepID=UPI00048655DB|nr:PfkB family carbohydrate kinase [Olivibacter sitiensis]